MKILAFAASLRKDSYNRKLIGLATEVAREAGAVVDLAEFREFDMPLYDGDVNVAQGLPPGALELNRRIEAVDGIMIASPEYNYSLPGTLKNAIDWISRARPVPIRGKSGLLLAASTSIFGGIRGLWQLRIPLEGLGVFLYPDMFALSSAAKAFDEKGRIIDPVSTDRMTTLVRSYVATASRLAAP